MKIVRLDEAFWPRGYFGHWCPACGAGHEIAVEQPQTNGAQWKYDGNVVSPTIAPSVNIGWGRQVDPNCEHEGGRCHYVITAGKITYCDDCTHAMRGQVVDLPEIPEGKYLTSVRAALRA